MRTCRQEALKKYFPNGIPEWVGTPDRIMATTEGAKWYEVNPLAIDQNLFQKSRMCFSWMQEDTRKLILDAFDVLNNNPERYGQKFITIIPMKTWREADTASELRRLAYEFGGNVANWVEQALEWAQRICNGASWKDICDYYDTEEWRRLVIWKDGCERLVGGCRRKGFFGRLPASYISDGYHATFDIYDAVPLIVVYEK